MSKENDTNGTPISESSGWQNMDPKLVYENWDE